MTAEPAAAQIVASNKLIFGCGYLGARVARLWSDAGANVHCVTRDEQRAANLAATGLLPIVAEITQPQTLRNLPAAATVLFAVGYDRSSGQPIEQVYVDGLRNVLEHLPASIERFIYISSTGVYGDFDGEWVDEDSPCNPQRPGGVACLAAEQLLQASQFASRAIILRLAGIYGPGRIPRRDTILSGQPVPAPSNGYLNLIHVDDAAAIVLSAEQHAQPPQRWLVSDGSPAPRREYYRELARLLNAPAPTFVDPPTDSPAASRAAADKRISNARLLKSLPIELRYPSYREGLAAIVAGE